MSTPTADIAAIKTDLTPQYATYWLKCIVLLCIDDDLRKSTTLI